MRFLLILALLLPAYSFAGEAKDMAEDPVMERRMIQLAEKVRCLVCQSEPVSNSHSDWSNDVRAIMREKMKEGATDQQIMDMLVERFGKSVLFDPPVDKETMPLWSAPFILLLLGGLGLYYQLKSRRSQVTEAALSVQDEQRASSLLNDDQSAVEQNGKKDTQA
ncbi:MAG: cytochrome C biogenesis protein CcmH [Gallionellales bacterium RIFOXYB12_FULL_54_9]|nr:MAG: cytochrome C biogenesis protein CcmH [Gallionellales bacterium RIFOXYB12_FULL_54_9]